MRVGFQLSSGYFHYFFLCFFPEFAAHCPSAVSVEEDTRFLRQENEDQLLLGKYIFFSLFHLLLLHIMCNALPVRMQGTVPWQCQQKQMLLRRFLRRDYEDQRFQVEETMM